MKAKSKIQKQTFQWNESCKLRCSLRQNSSEEMGDSHLRCPVASEVVPLHAQPLHQIDALHQAAAPKEGQQHVRGHLDLRRARLPVM